MKKNWETFFGGQKLATTHDFLVRNRECNTERGFKNQLYIELGFRVVMGMWIIYAKSVVFGMAVLFRTILCSSNLGSFIRSCALYKMGLKFLQSYIFEFQYSSCNFTKLFLKFSLLLKVLLKIRLLHKVWCRYCT